jgi:hypothetical protein
MTTRTRLCVGAAILAAAIGTETTIAWRQHTELALQRHALEILERRTTQLVRDRAAQRVAVTATAPGNPPAETGASTDAPAESWLDRVRGLRAWFEQHPSDRIPELDCLRPAQWLELAKSFTPGAGEDARRERLAQVRAWAKFAFLEQARDALVLFCHAHDGELPARLAQLAEYFEPPPPAGVLDRYAIVRSGKIYAVSRHDPVVVEQTLVDALHDQRCSLVGMGGPLLGVQTTSSADHLNLVLANVQAAFAAQHDGRQPATAEELAPYLEPDGNLKLADLQAFWDSPLRKK